MLYSLLIALVSYMNLSGDLLNCHLDLFGAMILSVLRDYLRCSTLFYGACVKAGGASMVYLNCLTRSSMW